MLPHEYDHDHDREMCLLHSKLASFQRREKLALDFIKQTFEDAQLQKSYVAFSGGKDSTVVLDMVRQIKADIPAIFYHDEWLFPETEAFVASVSNLITVKSPVKHAEWFTSWQNETTGYKSKKAEKKGGNIGYAIEHGFDAAFVGVRADESGKRAMFLRKYGPLHFNQGFGMWQINPLAWWSTKDIWAYILSHGLAYNKAYDKLAALGVPLDRQRVGPFAVERVLGYGQAALLKRGWPDLFNRFAAAYPQIRQYL